MKCSNCGCENVENAKFCQRCGSVLESDRGSLTERMLRLLKDNLFMALCILQSISTGVPLIGGDISVISILITIFLWLVFAQGKKDIVASDHVRCISGTIFASYVVAWVMSGILAFCSLLFVIFALTMDKAKLWNLFHSQIEPYMNRYFDGITLTTSFYLLLIALVVVIIAVICACLNVFGTRRIHRFVQSLYKNLECGQMGIVKRGAAQTWMMVFGILHAASAIFLPGGNAVSFLGNGCSSAVFILGSILVGKYFGDFR